MRNILLTLGLILTFSSTVFCIDWPAYHRAQITTSYNPGNQSQNARLNADKIITNNKINCVSDWTIKFIEGGYFEIWMDSNPQNKKIGHNKYKFLFQQSLGILEIACEEKNLNEWTGKRIFAHQIPSAGDIFYIHITANGYEYGDITGTYCDLRPGSDWAHSYHSGVDIGNVQTKAVLTDPIKAECHIYPVRDGDQLTVYKHTDGSWSFYVRVSTGVYDAYVHLFGNDSFPSSGASIDFPVESSGANATLLSQFVYHPYPHLHYAVYDNDLSPRKSIKNPLHNHLNYTESPLILPAIVDDPTDQGILFKTDDAKSSKLDSVKSNILRGSVDIEARMADNNGDSSRKSGINQIGYYLYTGFGDDKQFRESRIFLDQNIFCGESGQPEYSPYYFDLYGYSSVDYTTIFGKGNEQDYEQHEFFYKITNNQDALGGKAGLSAAGCWDTAEQITTYAGDTDKYPDGPYTVLVRAADIFGNWSDDSDSVNSRSVSVLNNDNQIIYVDDDHFGAGTLDDPYHTISEAVLAVGTPIPSLPVMIYVAPGTYNSGETFPIEIPAYTTITGAGRGLSNVTGNGTNPVFLLNQDESTLSDFTISGGGSSGVADVIVEGTDDVKVQDCEIRNCEMVGDLSTQMSGINLHNDYSTLIESCLIHDYASNGLRLSETVRPDIAFCTIHGNGENGIHGISDVGAGLIVNSIISWNTLGVRAEDHTYLGFVTNDIYEDGDPWYYCDGTSEIYGYGGDNIAEDPMYEGGFYLQRTSYCVDYGVAWAHYHHYPYDNWWYCQPPIFVRTTDIDNPQYSGGIFDYGNPDRSRFSLPSCYFHSNTNTDIDSTGYSDAG